MMHDTYSDDYIRSILKDVQTIAIIGASPNNVRPSYFVTRYLIDKDYKVFPVNPGHAGKSILGQTVYASLADIPEPVDMVDIFRNSEAAGALVDDALRLEPLPKVIWMQLTVRNDAAARRAEAQGLRVVMNRCPKIEFGRLSGEIGWLGVNSGVISSRRLVRRTKGFQNLGLRET